MPPITMSTLLGLLATAASVSAHGFVDKITIDGTVYTGYMVTEYPYESDPPASIGWTEDATDLGYIAPDAYASGDIICHKNATNAQLSATVAAGGTVELQWNTWPTSHHGPVIDYLANCDGDCATVDKTSLEFFKIDASGLINDTTAPGTWASDNLISNNYTWTVTIPDTIAAGNYVLRHEIIALHSASSEDGAQNYPQCINLEVTGGGSDTPTGTLGEALYNEDDPGILINIYTTGITYTIPGPSLYTGGSGSATSAATSAASVAASTTAAAASSAAATSVAAAASSSAVATTFATSIVASSSSSVVSTAAAAQTSAPTGDDDTCDA